MLLLIIHLQFAAAFTFYLQATREREGKVITGKHTHTFLRTRRSSDRLERRLIVLA